MPEAEAALPKRSGRSRPIRVCLLGSEGSGKTCFLGGLAILGEPNRDSPLTVTPSDPATASYLEELANTLRRQEWPPPTNMTNILTLRVVVERDVIEIVVVDYPGEDFREALRTLKREQIETLYEHYSESDAILLLFDPHEDLPDDPALRDQQIERQMAHLQAIADIWAERSHKKPAERHSQVDVAVVITKSDSIANLDHPAQARKLFRKHARNLDRKIQHQASDVQHFAVSAVGAADATDGQSGPHSIPARELTPVGYDQIFRWIHRRHHHRKNRVRRRLGCGVVLVAATLIIAYASYVYVSRQQLISTLENPNLSSIEKLEGTATAGDSHVLQQRGELLERELADVEERLTRAENEAAVSAIIEELLQYRAARPGARESELKELLEQAAERKQFISYQRIQDAFTQNDDGFVDVANDFLAKYNTSARCEQVRHWLSLHKTIRQEKARQRIKAIPVHDPASLLGKSQRIFEFLDEFRDALTAEEIQQMKRAAELGRQFAERHTYNVTLKRSGGFHKPRSQGVWLFLKDGLSKEYDSPGSSKSVTWEPNELKIEWTSGESVKIVLRDRGYGDEDVAWMTNRGPIALQLLGKKQVLTTFAKDWEEYCSQAFIEFSIQGITEEDWAAIHAYLTPGEVW